MIDNKSVITKCDYGAVLIIRAIGKKEDLILPEIFFANFLDKEPKNLFDLEGSKIWFTNEKDLLRALSTDYWAVNYKNQKDKEKLQKESDDYAKKWLDSVPFESIVIDNKEKVFEHSISPRKTKK